MGNYRQPSKRQRNGNDHETLNLVPMVDSLFNVIFFLIITTTFFSIYEIKSPIPLVSTDENDIKNKLNLLLELNKNEIVLSDAVNGNTLKKFSIDDNNVSESLENLHQHLVQLKKTAPNENTIILNPNSDIDYDFIVKTMDAIRDLYKTDETIYFKDQQGIDTKSSELFSNIIFGNINE